MGKLFGGPVVVTGERPFELVCKHVWLERQFLQLLREFIADFEPLPKSTLRLLRTEDSLLEEEPQPGQVVVGTLLHDWHLTADCPRRHGLP